MLINVPQYIDVEDKVAGPLTMKQLGWMIALGIILVIMWNLMPAVAVFVAGFPIALIFLALAFYRPYGQSLGSFILFAILYYFRPKIYTWKRSSEREQFLPKIAPTDNVRTQNKRLSSESIKELARLVDSEGTVYDNNIEEVLKKYKMKK